MPTLPSTQPLPTNPPSTAPAAYRLLKQLQDRNASGRLDHAPSGVAAVGPRVRHDKSRVASASELADPAYPIDASALVVYKNDKFVDGGVVLDLSGAMYDFASELHGYLKEKWLADVLPVPGLQDIRSIQGYDLTLEPYDPEQQLKSTLRIPHHRIGHVFRKVPGLRGLADQAHLAMCRLLGEDEGRDLELYDSHLLKQRSGGTAGGGSFGPHRDNHDDPTSSLLKYTFIVKLSNDPARSRCPSQMQVLEGGAYPPLSYGPRRGSCVLFRSQDLHTSLPTHSSTGEVVKIAFFFRQRRSMVVRPIKQQEGITIIERDHVEGGWRRASILGSSSDRSEPTAPYLTRNSSCPLPFRDPTAPYPPNAKAPRVDMPPILPVTPAATITPHKWRPGAGMIVVNPDGGALAAFMSVRAPFEYMGITRDAFIKNVMEFRQAMRDAGGCDSCGSHHP